MNINNIDVNLKNIVTVQPTKQVEVQGVHSKTNLNSKLEKTKENVNIIGVQGRNEELNKEEIEQLTEALNSIAEITSKGLKFKIHEESEKLYVEVLDVKTNKVIKEIPPKELLDLVARIDRMVGLFIDEQA